MMYWRLAASALSIFLALPAVAAPRAHADIFRTVRSFELGQDGSLLTPNATLEMLDLPVVDRDRKRLWTRVPQSEVFERYHVRQMSIAGVWRDRATANATTASRIYYHGIGGLEFSGTTHILFDRLQLRRVGGRWLIDSIARRVRRIGSDVAWHRRQALRRGASAR